MPRPTAPVPFAASLIALLPLLAAPSPGQDAGITWHTDFAAARQLAAGRQAPLLVVFRCER